MSDIPYVLARKKIKKEDYGFDRLTDFLAEFSSANEGGFLELTWAPRGRGSAAVAVLHERTRSEGRVRDPGGARAGRGGTALGNQDDHSRTSRRPGQGFLHPDQSSSYGSLPNSFCDEVFVPFDKQEILKGRIPGDMSVLSFLDRSWSQALSEGSVASGENGDWSFYPRDVNGERIKIIISLNRDSAFKRKWRVAYVADSPDTTNRLEGFTDVSVIRQHLPELAEMAIDESWGEGLSILDNYLRVTFSRIRMQDRVRISGSGEGFAAFNTGLLSSYFDDIFAVFKGRAQGGRWIFRGFETASGSGPLSRELSERFHPLPEPATYFSKKEDLLLDPYAEIVPVYDHILLDRMRRLPLPYLKMKFSGDPTLRNLVEKAASNASVAGDDPYGRMAEIVRNSPALLRSMRDDLDSAIRTARRRVRWNFKTAVPIYYPKYNGMNLLLPLQFGGAADVDVALVVSRLESGNYRGSTILKMEQAYMDARIVCPPESSWLRSGFDGRE